MATVGVKWLIIATVSQDVFTSAPKHQQPVIAVI